MSHFTVLVIDTKGYNDIHEALLPYGERSEDFFEWTATFNKNY